MCHHKRVTRTHYAEVLDSSPPNTHTHTQTHKTITVTLSAHARRGLMKVGMDRIIIYIDMHIVAIRRELHVCMCMDYYML